MESLQVRNSLFANSSIDSLLNAYDFNNLKSGFLIRGLNDSYSVFADGEKYIFRIYRKGWRGKSDILYELEAINHLSECGCPVSTPVKRKDGDFLTEIHAPEGTRYGVLFTFTKGDRPEITKENCSLIGESLGKIHNLADSFEPLNRRSFELDRGHLLDEPLSLIKPVIPDHSFLDELSGNLRNGLLARENLEYGFCHGDYHNFNMHLYGNTIESFDFDCCGPGFRAYDLTVFWWNLKQNYPAQEGECWDAFLNGYLSQRNIPDEKTLLKFVTLRRIWFMGILLKNDDVFGTHWINGKNLGHFLSQLEKDAESY